MKIVTIITTKNRLELFEKAFQSVTSQSRKSDKIIVVSDSTDENFDKELAIIGENAELIKDTYTHNYAGSLNTVIHNIIAANLFDYVDYDNIYIATLDDDDAWDNDYLAKCESAVTSQQDFVVSGITYCNENGNNCLSIPHELCIDSFLSGNPHIQGSNTFIKFSTLLKAGMFDENMSSTTDRDLFVRVMMLNPTYAVIDKHLVCVNAYNDRQRITNGSDKKADGLKKFFYKYSCLMSEDVKSAFFKRAEDLFSITKRRITHINSTTNTYNYISSPKKYDGNLIIGFIATDYNLGLRLLKQLCELKRKNTRIVILVNFEESIGEYVNLLDSSGYRYDFLTHDRLIGKIKKTGNCNVSEEALQLPIRDISVARSLLQLYLYEFSSENDVVWVLDEDMELVQLANMGKTITEIPLDVDNEIAKYKGQYDAVIGQYSLDAPLPALSSLKCSLLDYVYHTLGFNNEKTVLQTSTDYYYDLSNESRLHLETPIPYNQDVDIDIVFSGKAFSRPLYLTHNGIEDAKSRGGNTLIFNRELLKIPNWSIRINDKMGRRGDYFWVLEAKSRGHKIVSVPFSTLHNRSLQKFDIDKELNKLLLDLIGSSFTKACEAIGVNSDKNEFYSAYKNFFVNRLSSFVSSFYRIIGLLSVIGEDNYSAQFSYSKLNNFIKTAEAYTTRDAVLTAYSELCHKLDMQEKMQSCNGIETWLKTTFQIPALTTLGNGGEGVVFTDGRIVYKHFFAKPKRWEFLQSIATKFRECNELYSINLHCIDEHYLITYPYEKSSKFEYTNYSDFRGKIHKDLAELIMFCKRIGIVFTNIKRENFILVNNRLKLIDYGKSFEPFDENAYNKMVARSYEMIRYPKLSEADFKQLIQLYYLDRTAPHDSGIERFRLLIEKRYKEDIHDDLIRALVQKHSPQKVLDYGAGKCKIANSLSENCAVAVFDIDVKTVTKRADEKLTIYKAAGEIPQNAFDIVISNLVLCCVDKDVAAQIVANVTKALKPNGHAIISICNPFYNNVQNTELRSSGLQESYYQSSVYEKSNNHGALKRTEYHRPIEYYVNLLKRHGLTIKDTHETDGINIDTLNPIGEHIVFDCEYSPYAVLENTSLLIKTNPMEADCVYQNIRHIVSTLENGIRFFERIVVVDASKLANRARRYAPDNLAKLKTELLRAKDNGLVDRIIYAPTDKHTISNTYKKYFGISADSSHAKNSQALFATLYGFDNVKTKYVFQTDSDILYHTENNKQIIAAVSELDKGAVTVTLSVPQKSHGQKFGCRTEVRSSLLNLDRVNTLLPLRNEKENGALCLPWHRALDPLLSEKESVRLEDENSWFLHPENNLKKDPNILSKVQYLIERAIITNNQYGQVNVVYDETLLRHVVKRKTALYIRGRNTPCEKLKRLFDSIKKQNNQNFDIVYVDDASYNGNEEYAKFLFEHDSYFTNRVYPIFNRVRGGELANLVYVMQHIITDPETIVINVDSDDYLVDTNAIDKIINVFNNGAELTVGNCVRHDKPLKSYKVYSFQNVWERDGDNIWLHPKCFRRKLFDSVDIDADLKLDGKFVEVNTDFAFMLPMVAAAKKCNFIDKVLYYFEPSEANQSSTNEYESTNKNRIKKRLLNRQRQKNKPKIALDSLEFLNSPIDKIFDKDKLYISNEDDLDSFKAEISKAFFEIERLFRKVFQSDISLTDNDINRYTFNTIFVSIKKDFGNKYFSLLDNKGRKTSVSGCVYLTWLLDRIRNLVSHAVIGWDLQQKFTMDSDFIQSLPIIADSLKYADNNVLTVAGMIVTVLVFCKYETITEFSEYFAKHWGKAIFKTDNTSSCAKVFFDFFKVNFSNNYCGSLNDCFIQDTLTISSFYRIKKSLFKQYSDNVTLAVANRKISFALKLSESELHSGADINGDIQTNKNTFATCLTINSGSHWGNVTFANTYRLDIADTELFCHVCEVAPTFSTVLFLYAKHIYKFAAWDTDTIAQISQLQESDVIDRDTINLTFSQELCEEQLTETKVMQENFAKFRSRYELLRAIFSQQAEKVEITPNETALSFMIDLKEKTNSANFACTGELTESGERIILKINKDSYWDGVRFATDYELSISDSKQFAKHSAKLPPLYLVMFLYLGKFKDDLQLPNCISKVMNKNTVKFYSECGVNDLLAPRTESQLKTSKNARAHLMNMFYDLEKAIICHEGIEVDDYLSMSKAIGTLNCTKEIAERIIVLRNYCAHAYSTNDCLKSTSRHRIDNKFILDTLKIFINYLHCNTAGNSNYEKYAKLLVPHCDKLTELFKGDK